ncbi:MAG TPA: MBL fold metallo-hydrolase [Chryseosolibacter sp.]|nr:MBL fold metallo-hydrolase [Chryseosolibacter sp.]
MSIHKMYYVVLLFLASFTWNYAQDRPAAEQFPIVVEDSTARMRKVHDGVYAIIHDPATDEWPHGNSGVVVGTKGVMVIDANYLPSRSRADIKLIRRITDKPITHLVFTHWHFDHNNGTIAYLEAFPDIKIISERNTRRFIELNGYWWSRSVTAQSSNKRKSLQQLEATRSSGKDKSGKEFTDEEKGSMDTIIMWRKNELSELEGLTVVPPNQVFDAELKIDLGKRQIVLKNMGPANSPNDVAIFLPKEKILFTGDILVQGPRPYTSNCWPIPWINVLKQLEAQPVNAIVPGHGPVLPDHQYTRQMRGLLEATKLRVEAMIEKGMTLEQIQSTINMDDQHKGVWDRGDAGKPIWNATINMLVERVWRGVRGQG